MNKILESAKVKIEEEMDRIGFIDDTDRTDRFLDNLARKLAEEEMLQGNDDIDLYYEKEEEIEELTEEILENIKNHMQKTYKKRGSTDETGHYKGCFYKNIEGLKKWEEE